MSITTISGLWGASASHYFSNKLFKKNSVFITSSPKEFEFIFNELTFFLGGEKVLPFPEYSQEPFENARVLADITAMRAETLHRLLTEKWDHVIVATQYSFMKTLPSPDKFLSSVVNIKINDVIDREELQYSLDYSGYILVEYVDGTGEFNFRGDIAEIFPPDFKNPVRIEFFDDEVEKIYTFDPDTRKKIEELKELHILPASEILCDTDDIISADLPAEIKEKAEIFGKFAGHHWLLPYVTKKLHSLSDYIKSTPDFFFLTDEYKTVFEHFAYTIEDRKPSGFDHKILNNFLDKQETLKLLNSGNIFLLSEIHSDDADRAGYSSIHKYFSYAKGNMYQCLQNFTDIVRPLIDGGYRVITHIESSKLIKSLENYIRDYGFELRDAESLLKTDKAGIYLHQNRISGGFESTESKLILVSDEDIFGITRKRAKRPKRETYGTTISDLEEGDYVVHVDYGIGIYRGLEHKDIGGVEGDFLKLEYEGSDILYVPLEAIGQLQKYIGSQDRKPQIHSLKSAAWKKIKSQAKSRAKKIALDLLKLYAERKVLQGYSFHDDGIMVRDFEQKFPYDETDDQLSAIADVYADMENEIPMERLVCGDVGFGKTEVAMRAACKAAAAGKQVGILVPTTVLARQHYETFVKRFEGLPVNIDYVSRMKTPGLIRKTLADVAAGKVDILIGTHRILSKDIIFNDLGLLIIDEEQRFGVAHKEKIKALKSNIDVLYLSATPIPRTLQLSLSGIRDISTIDTPPKEKMPVITNVIKSAEQIAEAAKKELSRGGQVYFLHNKVEDIVSIASDLKKHLPDAEIQVAHGQMSAGEMEKILHNFYAGKIDILVSTTIIENGVDIANANTIIINNAGHFGLSQLYQLKGRVGRSSRRGYCYLVVPNINSLQPLAAKRLKIVQQLSDLGSGVKIAFYDLQLRGAGDLLGAEQSGFEVKVGYELFLQMIEVAVKELKGVAKMHEQTQISSVYPYFISADYIEDMRTRFDYYKKFSKITNISEMQSLLDELSDIYGHYNNEAKNLGYIMMIKNHASVHNIDRVTVYNSSAKLIFRNNTEINPVNLIGITNKLHIPTKFDGEYAMTLMFASGDDTLYKLCAFFDELSKASNVSFEDYVIA